MALTYADVLDNYRESYGTSDKELLEQLVHYLDNYVHTDPADFLEWMNIRNRNV
jgi:hypothetical protein